MTRWSESEIETLKLLRAEGKSDAEIGEAIGRTPHAVAIKRGSLNLVKHQLPRRQRLQDYQTSSLVLELNRRGESDQVSGVQRLERTVASKNKTIKRLRERLRASAKREKDLRVELSEQAERIEADFVQKLATQASTISKERARNRAMGDRHAVEVEDLENKIAALEARASKLEKQLARALNGAPAPRLSVLLGQLRDLGYSCTVSPLAEKAG